MTRKKKTRFIFVTGGVISGIGKGITVASLGRLLISSGYKVFPIKIDPYLNEDAGTMNPFQHGEVFVTDDGAETDLDLGHYERFMSLTLDRRSNFTSGSVLRAVLDKERKGTFLGTTIQFVPHVTDEIQRRILSVAKAEKSDFIIVEIGGTIGADMEIQPFAEAVRQITLKEGRENCCFIHLVKVDYTFPADEEKTKPIQHSVRLMQGLGLSPDILVVRAKRPIEKSNIQKISLSCSISKKRIIQGLDVKNTYEIPVNLEKQGLTEVLLDYFGARKREHNLSQWKRKLAERKTKKAVRIGMVGKYHGHPDAYISVKQALYHGALDNRTNIEIITIDSEKEDLAKKINDLDGIVIPGGYGVRGTAGMIKTVEISRKKKIPYLGLCFGLQMAVIEFSRDVLGWRKANSTELDKKTPYPVIDILKDQKSVKELGGSQRLGSYPAKLKKGALVWDIYKKWRKDAGLIWERHRHRYEVNPKYHRDLEEKGLVFGGLSPDGRLVEFIELPRVKHPFFVATQAHPEFKSRFLEPHPLFSAFVNASLKFKNKKRASH
jgi:CTP synthase